MKMPKWYISHELLYFHTKRQGPKGLNLTVWENLILLKARNPEDAYRKALKRGRLNEQSVRIDGEEGYCKFRGLRDLVLVQDELEDGAELEWREFRMNGTDLVGMTKRKRQMQAFSVPRERS
jgi:hypothetical protein